ncbi:hypothetical protein Holit_01707 [Hollandina sp. SP2]
MALIPIVERDTFRGSPYPSQTFKRLTRSFHLERKRVNTIGFPPVSARFIYRTREEALGFLSAAMGINLSALWGYVLHKRR